MPRTLKKLAGVILLTVFGMAVLPVTASFAAEGEEAIKARIDFMGKELFGHFKVLAAYAKSGTGTLEDVEKNARAIAELAPKIPDYFPEGTGRGNYPDKVTRALPVIWTDWSGFTDASKALAKGSAELAELASKGDRDAVVRMIGASGFYSKTQIGCAGCHEKFQGPKAK